MQTTLNNTSVKDYTSLLSAFENYFEQNKPQGTPKELYEAANHILKTPGKKIRPMLCLLSGNMFTHDISLLMPAALSVELYHNSTLIHDDIMDQADVRRGRPTVHMIYGINDAINAGNLLTNEGYKSLLNYEGRQLSELLDCYTKVTIQVIEGQAMDMMFEKTNEVNREDYLKMIAYKTSVLLAASCKMGAIAGGADKADIENMYQFGLNLGISFQLKDDFLDAFGDMAKVGKKKGGDIIQNKKTLLMIEALRLASEKDKTTLKNLPSLADDNLKVATALSIFENSGAKKIVEDEMEKYFSKALYYLNELNLPFENKNPMLQLAKEIYLRDF
jgi:geranylgeranyl diphosphate synthase, type II